MNIARIAILTVASFLVNVCVAQSLPPIQLDGQVSRIPSEVATVETAPFTPIQLQLRISTSHFPPEFLGATAQGQEVRATFFARAGSGLSFDPNPLYAPTPVTLPGLPPGSYKLLLGNALAFNLPTSSYAETSTLNIVVSGLPASMLVTPMAFMPFTIPPLGVPVDRNWYRPKHYMALGQSEVVSLLALNTPEAFWTNKPMWTLTEPPFRAWPNVPDAPSATVPVCRFFNPAAVTHFYSAKPSDCALLAASSGWVNEGIAFRTLLPVNGVCPLATQPVYRLFSQTLSNHRYTQSAETYNALQLRGYVGEGAAFCSPNA